MSELHGVQIHDRHLISMSLDQPADFLCHILRVARLRTV